MASVQSRARATNAHAMAHPVHQRQTRVHRAAVTDAVTLYGWGLTEGKRLSTGITTGPCARCRARHERYGPNGRPLCARCEAA